MDNNSDNLPKTNDEWRQILTPEQYHITREKGTEAPFTGKYYATKDKGVYRCSNCGAELFSSDTKYDSGSGWPSFYQPINENIVEEQPDDSAGMLRKEVICHNCGAHLGHVFDDGPQDKTGLRYCINSAALKLEKQETEPKTNTSK